MRLGTDGGKMSKSRGNAVALADDAGQTAHLIRGAKTDSTRHTTYEPATRPEVSSLVLLAAMCTGRDPRSVADEIGAGAAGMLKKTVTEAVNEHLAPIRAGRTAYARERGFVPTILRDGNERANAVAEATLDEVRRAMKTA